MRNKAPSKAPKKTPRDAIRIPSEWLDAVDAAMKEKGLTQDQQLAAAAGLSPTSITRLRRNEAAAPTISAVAKALGLSDPTKPLADAADRRWLALGQKIRERYPERHARTMRYLELWLETDEARAVFLDDFSDRPIGEDPN